MRKSAIALLLAASLLVSGCGFFRKTPASSVPTMETNSVKGDSMTLTIELPKRNFTPGENINLRIIARNTSDKTITFKSPTSALYKVQIFHKPAMGWRWVNQYPQAAMKITKTWSLQPGQSIKYNQFIPVGRDWPMDEALKLVVELEGGPDLQCPMIIYATAE